jgi:putative transposase
LNKKSASRLLISNGIEISMDGKGAWRDNVFVERIVSRLPRLHRCRMRLASQSITAAR